MNTSIKHIKKKYESIFQEKIKNALLNELAQKELILDDEENELLHQRKGKVYEADMKMMKKINSHERKMIKKIRDAINGLEPLFDTATDD